MDHDPPHFSLYVQRELRRIGIDLDRLGGLATVGGPPHQDFLRWLRAIPGGLGHDAFLDRLTAAENEGGLNPVDPGAVEAPDVATFVDPELDEQLAYAVEFDRVVPPATLAGLTIGYDWPRGRDHALSVLRALPDGAGLDAFLRALVASAETSG